MPINFFRLDPIRRFALFLLIFSIFALVYNFSNAVLVHLASTLGFGLILFWLYSRISTKHKNIWDTVITSLIIFLLLHYGGNPFFSMLAIFFALTLKFFIEWRGSPVVNPAAGSLLLTAGVLALIPGIEQPFVSWWGTSFWALPWGVSASLLLMAVWVLGGFYVWKKWMIFLSFLLVHLVILLATEEQKTTQFIFTDSTLYFLAAIMLPEPKTSPLLPWKQGAYGTLAALFYNGLLFWGIPYYELFTVVGANLFNAAFKNPLRKG